MKVQVLKCPECKANLEIEEGRPSCYCQYCGCKIVIDTEEQTSTYNKNTTYTKRYINDADVIRAKNEDRKEIHNFRQSLILIGLLFLIPIGIFTGLYLNKAVAQNEGKISAGYYKDLIGEDVKTVEAHFQAAGFINIELIDLNDAGLAFWNDGKVTTISVGGNTDFDTLDWFEPDTEVVISYH